MAKGFKERVFHVIDDGFDSDWYDKVICGLIVFSLISVVIGSLKSIPSDLAIALHWMEVFTVLVLTFDYALRIWTADLKYPDSKAPALRTVFSVMGVIDLLAFLPFYAGLLFPAFAAWNFARVARALKLVRYVQSARVIVNVVKAERKALTASVFLIGVILFVAATLMYAAEGTAQPDKFPDIVTTFWWAIVTLTTVGYGDVFPITGLGRAIGGCLAISGIFIVAIPTGILSGGFLNEYKKARGEKDGE